MNIKNKFQFRTKFALAIVVLCGSLFMMQTLQTPPVSAQNSADCSNKEKPKECRERLEDKCKDRNSAADVGRCREAEAKRIPDKRGAGGGGSDKPTSLLGGNTGKYQCGNGDNAYKAMKINFGCLGEKAPAGTGPIQDLAFSIIRFMSAGVGLVIVISIIAAGIQYSTSEGNPEATQAAKNRIRSTIIGLLIYIFAFSLIQYLVPGGVFASILADPLIIDISQVIK